MAFLRFLAAAPLIGLLPLVPRQEDPVTFAYVPHGAEGGISVLVEAEAGDELRPAGRIPSGEGTRHSEQVVAHPSGRCAYVIESPSRHGPAAISVHSVDPKSGWLTYRATLARSLSPLRMALSADGRRAWITDAEAKQLRSFEVLAGGARWIEDHAALPTGDGPTAIVRDPAGRFLWVLNRKGCSVSRFRLDGRGRPQFTGEDILLNGSAPVAGCLDPTGSRFFVTIDTWDLLLSMAVDPREGRLETINAAGTGSDPRGVTYVAEQGRVYVAEEGSDSVSAWDVDPETGALGVRLGPILAGERPQSVAVKFGGRRLSVVGTDAAVRLFDIDRREPLVPLRTAPLNAVPCPTIAATSDAPPRRIQPAGLCVGDPAQRLLRRTGIDGSDARTPLGITPDLLAADPQGRWIAVAQRRPGRLSLVAVDAGGQLAHPTEDVDAKHIVADLAASPSGRQLVVALRTPPVLRCYDVDPSGRSLSFVGEVRLGAGPTRLAWDPTGRWVAASHAGANRVSVARVEFDGFIGAAQALQVAGSPRPLLFSRDGRTLLVGLASERGILPLDFDPETGGLTERRTLQVACPGPPTGLAHAGPGDTLAVACDGPRARTLLAHLHFDSTSGELRVASEAPAPADLPEHVSWGAAARALPDHPFDPEFLSLRTLRIGRRFLGGSEARRTVTLLRLGPPPVTEASAQRPPRTGAAIAAPVERREVR